MRGRTVRDRCDVLLVGGYPPPYGGVNVHCRRLAASLLPQVDVQVLGYLRDAAPGFDPEVPFVYRAGAIHKKRLRALRIIRRLAQVRCRIAHFHAGSFDNFALLAPAMLAVLPRSAKTVVTIHSGSFPRQIAGASWLRRRWIASLLRRFDCVVCVSDAICQTVAGLAPDVHREVIPAFLPAVSEEAPAIRDAVANLRHRAERVYVVSGFARPYYGFHTVLEALEQDHELGSRVAVVFAFYSEYEDDYYQSVVSRLDGVSGLHFDNLTPEHFAYLLSVSDGLVRPTDRDGDSVAVREARAMGKQVLASDCVARPKGTRLFVTMDASSLSEALYEALEDRTVGTGAEDTSENWAALARVYRLLGVDVGVETVASP